MTVVVVLLLLAVVAGVVLVRRNKKVAAKVQTTVHNVESDLGIRTQQATTAQDEVTKA